MWTKDQIKGVLTSKPFAIAAVSVGSFASGVAGSYIYLSNRLARKYQDIANEEILSAKLFYAKKAKADEFADPTALAEKYEEEVATDSNLVSFTVIDPIANSQGDMLRDAINILDTQGYTNYSKSAHHAPPSEEEVSDVKESVKRNVFDTAREERRDFDANAELEKKEDGNPYIITIAEYMSGSSGCSQSTVTYYEGDDVVANEIDIPWEKYEEKLGDDNLHFGCGSSDPNIVYIRNEDLDEEYEVVRSRGTFEQEVAGGFSDSGGKGSRFRDED